MAGARVRCRTCGQAAVWSTTWLDTGGQGPLQLDPAAAVRCGWLHAADAIRSPWQPQSSVHAHPVIPERAR
jgi:hypothetical protein